MTCSAPSVSQLLLAGEQRLRGAGIGEARLDAELLLAEALGTTRGLLRLHRDPVRPEAVELYEAWLGRRERREPLPYLIGWQEFMGLRLTVDRRVLVPRWDSEPLIEATVTELQGRSGPLCIADLCTGSGAWAVALATLLPAAEVWASDLSGEAAALATDNAARLGLAERVHVLVGDLAAPLSAAGLDGRCAAVVCNPPYVTAAELAAAEPEVSEWEPRLALDGGADGLAVLRRVAAETARLLVPGGLLVVECGDHQAGATADLLRAAGWRVDRVLHDLGRRERGVLAYREED